MRLERDVEARDDYGRLLGYVYLAADGTFVNLEIVEQGYATLLTIPAQRRPRRASSSTPRRLRSRRISVCGRDVRDSVRPDERVPMHGSPNASATPPTPSW